MNHIHTFSRQLWKAIQDRDVESFLMMTYDNARFVHMGVTFTRDQEAEVINEGRILYQKIEFEAEDIQKMDSTWIVLNKIKLEAVVNGNVVTNPFVVTEVYIEKDSALHCASLSFTKITY